MILEDLRIQKFRNLLKNEFSFVPGKNLIFGKNGVGKTSVLEAIFLLGFGRSFFNVKKSNLVNFLSSQFAIWCQIRNKAGRNELQASFFRKFGLFLNEKKVNVMDVNRYFYPVFFSSAGYHLQIDSKPHLRKMVNRFIFGVIPLYMHYILCYNRALKQKNILLKTGKGSTELSSWNKMMSEMAEKIMETRIQFVRNLNQEIKTRFHKNLEMVYRPSMEIPNGPSRDYLYQKFEGLKNKEMKHNQALIGPHLDSFHLKLNDKNLKFNSSGEKKINLLIFYIAFIELFKRYKDEYPLFLVDDFDTAIDENNIDFLMKSYPEMQIIVTSVKTHRCFDRLIELKKES